MIALAELVDADARDVRKQWEERVDAPQKKAAELIAEARRTVSGTSGYPDATFSLRLSYGKVAGTEHGVFAGKSSTTVGELFSRSTGEFPCALSPSWQKAKAKLATDTTYNIATTNDIIGGNSGSPLVDKNGDVVGLVFDGNLPSIGGRYHYDPADNRAVAVHGAIIRTALTEVYGADHVWGELSAR
jgi:hypothetical protein